MGGADEGQMRRGAERFVEENSMQRNAPQEAQTTDAALSVPAARVQHAAAQFQPAKNEGKQACRVQQQPRPYLRRPSPSMPPTRFQSTHMVQVQQQPGWALTCGGPP